jgi:hypothetical protein
MDVAEFEDWLDRLGEDLSQWPDPQRQAARTLLENSAEARSLLEESVLLRDALAAPRFRAPSGLADRIVAQASRIDPAPKPVQSAFAAGAPLEAPFWNYRWLPAMALSICFLVGVAFGVLNRSRAIETNPVDLPTYVAYVVIMAHTAD